MAIIVNDRLSTRAALPPPEQLSVLDILTGHYCFSGVYYLRKKPNVELIKASLQSALDQNPAVSSSLKRGGNSFWLNCENVGVSFTVVYSDADSAPSPDSAAITEGSELIDPEPQLSDVLYHAQPLHYFRLTLFKQAGATLGVKHVHSFADGRCMAKFMEQWAAIYNGTSIWTENSSVSRADITALGSQLCKYPSTRFSHAPADFDVLSALKKQAPLFGSVRKSLPKEYLTILLERCRHQSDINVSSSDVIHALLWKAFAQCSDHRDDESCSIFSIFDLRGASNLNIPVDFFGNAVIERYAELPFSQVRREPIYRLAEIYRTAIKPILENEIRQDIGYLNEELKNGHIDSSSGTFSHFSRRSLRACTEGTGIYLNDMRFLGTNNIEFDGEPAVYDLRVHMGYHHAAVHALDDSHIAIRYTGLSKTLSHFFDELSAY